MSLKRHFKAAFDAIEQLAATPDATPFDRSARLAQLRNRISDHIVRLAEQRERDLGRNPVSQRDGD